jgi:hypothetical protein
MFDSIKSAFKLDPVDAAAMQGREKEDVGASAAAAPAVKGSSGELKQVQQPTNLGGQQRQDLNPEAQKELANLRSTLQNRIQSFQSSRMNHHAYEPISLPASQPVSRVSPSPCRARGCAS